MQGNEKSAGKSQKKSWFQGLQSIVLCVLISVMDSFILEGINLLMK